MTPAELSTDLFDYTLPEHLIAQTPTPRRDASRLLVVDRAAHRVSHHQFSDLPNFLRPGDTLFRNNAAVLPARLHAQRPTGGQVECLLLRPVGDLAENEWWCLLRPGKKLPVGGRFGLPGEFEASVIAKREDGTAHVAFQPTTGATSIVEIAQRLGEMPLPPYIARAAGDGHRPADLERYQTVYANRARPVAAAAPTAGLHFTPDLVNQLESAGVNHAEITLHVGLGTFRPITTERVADHQIHREIYELPPATQQALFTPSGRRVAVGTTSVRSIEDYLARHPAPGETHHIAEADIFIYPPRTFRGVDALITNFHQPRSTLLCLVSAFLAPGSTEGIGWLREIYAEAIAREYRFFSYGDAMLIL